MFLAAGAAVAGSAAQARGTMNVPFVAGQILSGDNCRSKLLEDAVIATYPQVGCSVNVPVPLEAGRILRQVKVLYSSSRGTGDFHIAARLLGKEYRTMPDVGTVDVLWGFDSRADPGAGMVGRGLMTQSGIPPRISYPDSFPLSADHAYSVNVDVFGDAMFHGIQIIYD